MEFVQKKLFHLVPVVLAVTIITFLFVNLLPGDVAYVILGQEATPENLAVVRAELKLDQPFPVRYLSWLGGVLTGDFGRSFISHQPVFEAIMQRLPVTLELILITQFLVIFTAVPLGVLSAYKRGKWLDRIIGSLAFGLLSVPNFMMAILLIFLFSVYWGVLPATGYEPLSAGLWTNLRGFVLPALTLALIEWCALMRVLRADIVATLQEEYILVARAKGVPRFRILFFHALKPSLLSTVTLFAINVATMISGSLIVETVFALPGVGRLLVSAIYSRDYIMVQGIVLFAAMAFVVINFLVDTIYALIDPRIRHDQP